MLLAEAFGYHCHECNQNAHLSCTPLLYSRIIWPKLYYQSRGCYYIHPLLNPGKNALRSAPNYFTSSAQPCWKSPQITKLIGSTLLPYVVCKRSTEVYLGIRTKGEWNITALYEDFVLALITKASPALILQCAACPALPSTAQPRPAQDSTAQHTAALGHLSASSPICQEKLCIHCLLCFCFLVLSIFLFHAHMLLS